MKLRRIITGLLLSGITILSSCSSEPEHTPSAEIIDSAAPTPSVALQKEEYAHVLTLPSTAFIRVKVVTSDADQRQGLSGIADQDFPENYGMLFAYKVPGKRMFWMPDTYFDLDIIFLNSDLEVVHIERNTPHHPGYDEPPAIAETAIVEAHHVLEVKSGSEVAEEIEVGMKLQWDSSPSLQSIITDL